MRKKKEKNKKERRDEAPRTAPLQQQQKTRRMREKKKKAAVQPFVGVNLPSSVHGTNPLTLIKWTGLRSVKVSETRKTMRKDLLIVPETEEDSKKIYESMNREDIGTTAVFRPPKNSAEAKVEDALCVVVKNVDTKIREEEIEDAILEKQGLKVVRFINRASGRGNPKVKVTFDKKEEMEATTRNSRLFIGARSCRTEEYRKKSRILQC